MAPVHKPDGHQKFTQEATTKVISFRETRINVIPAKAGIHNTLTSLAPRLRGGDEAGINQSFLRSCKARGKRMAKDVVGDRKIPKRELTLAKIHAASRKLFYEKGFHESSVEEIATNSGIKRATFYLYYQRKEDIIVDLVRDDLRYQIEQYRNLTTFNAVDRAAVRNWLVQFRNAFDERRGSIPLYAAATDLASELTDSVDLHRKEVVDILGSRFESFDLDALGRADRSVQRAKCYMVIFMIESCMNTFSTSASAPTLDDGLDLLADFLHQFLTAGVATI